MRSHDPPPSYGFRASQGARYTTYTTASAALVLTDSCLATSLFFYFYLTESLSDAAIVVSFILISESN